MGHWLSMGLGVSLHRYWRELDHRLTPMMEKRRRKKIYLMSEDGVTLRAKMATSWVMAIL